MWHIYGCCSITHTMCDAARSGATLISAWSAVSCHKCVYYLGNTFKCYKYFLIFSGVVRYYTWSSKFWRLEFKTHTILTVHQEKAHLWVLLSWRSDEKKTVIQKTQFWIRVCLTLTLFSCTFYHLLEGTKVTQIDTQWPLSLRHSNSTGGYNCSVTNSRFIKLKWFWIPNHSLELNTLVSITVACYPIVN